MTNNISYNKQFVNTLYSPCLYCAEKTVKPTITYESQYNFDYVDLHIESYQTLHYSRNVLVLNETIKANTEFWVISDHQYIDLNIKEIYNSHHCSNSIYNKIFFYEFLSDKNNSLSGIDIVSDDNSLHFICKENRFVVYNKTIEMISPAVMDVNMSLENFLAITATDENIQNYLIMA